METAKNLLKKRFLEIQKTFKKKKDLLGTASPTVRRRRVPPPCVRLIRLQHLRATNMHSALYHLGTCENSVSQVPFSYHSPTLPNTTPQRASVTQCECMQATCTYAYYALSLLCFTLLYFTLLYSVENCIHAECTMYTFCAKMYTFCLQAAFNRLFHRISIKISTSLSSGFHHISIF